MRAVLKALATPTGGRTLGGAGVGGLVGGGTTAMAGGDTSDILRGIGAGAITGGALGLGSGGLNTVLKSKYAPSLKNTLAVSGVSGLAGLSEDYRRSVLGEKPLHIPSEMIDPNDPYFQEYYMQMQMQRPELFKQSSAQAPVKKATTSLADIETMEKVSGQVFGKISTPEGGTIVESNGRYITYDKTGQYTYGTFDTLEGAKTAMFNRYSYNPQTGNVSRSGFFGLGTVRDMGAVSSLDPAQTKKLQKSRSGRRALGQAKNVQQGMQQGIEKGRQMAISEQRLAQNMGLKMPGEAGFSSGQTAKVYSSPAQVRAQSPVQFPRAPTGNIGGGANPFARGPAAPITPAPAAPAPAAPTAAPTAAPKAGTLGKVLRRGGAIGLTAGVGYGLYRLFSDNKPPPPPPPSTYERFMTGASNLIAQAPQYLQAAQQMGFLGGGGGGYGQYQQMSPYQQPRPQGYGYRPYY